MLATQTAMAPLSAATLETLPTQLSMRPDTWLLIAWCNEQPVGLLNAFGSFSTFAAAPIVNVHDFYVTAAARGWGVVDALSRAPKHSLHKLAAAR